MAEVVEVQTKLPISFRANDFAKLFDEPRLSIWSQAHHFALVAVVRKPEELRRGRVNNPQRVRIFNLVQHLDAIIKACGPHSRNEIAKAVEGKQRRSLKR